MSHIVCSLGGGPCDHHVVAGVCIRRSLRRVGLCPYTCDVAFGIAGRGSDSGLALGKVLGRHSRSILTTGG